MSNEQAPEPPVRGDGTSLDFHSAFLTVQGEGPYTGHRAVFLRLAGCNLQCPGCDTEYTKGRNTVSEWELLTVVANLWHGGNGPDGFVNRTLLDPGIIPLVVITGGEPLRQPIGPLVKILLNHGYTVQIESNGTVGPDPVLNDLLGESALRGHQLALVVSPKTKAIHPVTYERATVFKYVVRDGYVDLIDGLPTVALEHAKGGQPARPRPGVPVYLTPYDEPDYNAFAESRRAVAKSAIRFGYIAQVQLHKLLEVE